MKMKNKTSVWAGDGTSETGCQEEKSWGEPPEIASLEIKRKVGKWS